MNNRTRLPLPEPAYSLPFPDDDELAFSALQMRQYSDDTLATERITTAHWQELAEMNLTLWQKTHAETAALRERVKVLEDALKVATDWLAEDCCPLGWNVDRLRAALEAK